MQYPIYIGSNSKVVPNTTKIAVTKNRHQYQAKMSGAKAPPPYAPTSTTSFTLSGSKNLEFHEEIDKSSFIKSPLHKTVYEALAEIYSIITVTEMIENSFLKDYITDKDKYTSTILRLINQYQIIIRSFENDGAKHSVLKDILGGLNDNHNNLLEELVKKFDLEAPLAVQRMEKGMPATMEHRATHLEKAKLGDTPRAKDEGGSSTVSSGRLVAEVTGNFITCMDALKLNYRTKDQLHPLLSDLVVSLNDLTIRETNDEGELISKSIEFDGKAKLVSWLIKINNLQTGELSQADIDLFLQDLDLAYKNFYTSLG